MNLILFEKEFTGLMTCIHIYRIFKGCTNLKLQSVYLYDMEYITVWISILIFFTSLLQTECRRHFLAPSSIMSLQFYLSFKNDPHYLAWNVPSNSALVPTTLRIEPSLIARTGGVPGISWYWLILCSLVSPLWVELGSVSM